MIPNDEKLYRGVSHAAWAYFFLYFNVNLGSLNILPDFMCYVLLWSAIGCLEEEERDLALLRPLCVLLGVWAGADWVFTLLGGTLDGRFRPMDLLLAVAAIYFHFQLLTDLANQPRLDPGAVEIGRQPVCHNPRCITQTEHYLPPLVKQNGGVDCCAYCDAVLD